MREEWGQVTVLVIGAMLVVAAVAGVAIDGTRVFLLRRTLQNAADGAAAAGVGEVDVDAYYASGGDHVVLTREDARRVAYGFLRERGLDGSASVSVAGRTVSVGLRGEVSPSFLALLGIQALPVSAFSRAEAVPGGAP